MDLARGDGVQAGVGELRPDFDPRVMAVAIRAAIDAVPRRLAHDPDLDVDSYAREIATAFDLATRTGRRARLEKLRPGTWWLPCPASSAGSAVGTKLTPIDPP